MFDVTLVPITDPDLVAAAIASTLGVQESYSQPVSDIRVVLAEYGSQ